MVTKLKCVQRHIFTYFIMYKNLYMESELQCTKFCPKTKTKKAKRESEQQKIIFFRLNILFYR